MEVTLPHTVRAGSTRIEEGTYQVTADTAEPRIVLAGPEDRYLLIPTVRSSKMRVESPSAELRDVSDEPRILLVVRTPPANELVVSLTIESR
jgi:hypothetical protein